MAWTEADIGVPSGSQQLRLSGFFEFLVQLTCTVPTTVFTLVLGSARNVLMMLAITGFGPCALSDRHLIRSGDLSAFGE